MSEEAAGAQEIAIYPISAVGKRSLGIDFGGGIGLMLDEDVARKLFNKLGNVLDDITPDKEKP